MGLVRTIAGQTVMTHYFSTEWEAQKYAGRKDTGWYYQKGHDPRATMLGPFKLLQDVEKDVAK